VGHRRVLHPLPTLRKFFAKCISSLRDRYRPWRKTRDPSPDTGGVEANPEWRSVTARTHPASGRPMGCRFVEVAALVAGHGSELGLEASSVFPLGCVTGPSFRLSPLSGIGVLREGPLHAAIKATLAAPGDRFDAPIGGFVIDRVRADGELVEVQTGGFSSLGRKLDALLDTHRCRIVYPVAAERRIVRIDGHGEVTSVRRSPKRTGVVEVFNKLVAFPSLLTHPHLTIEVLLLREDHIRGGRPERVGRRTRDQGERRLIDVLDRVEIRGPGDIVRMLPPLPSDPFSTRELAARFELWRVARPANGLLSADDGDHRGRGEARAHAAAPTTPRSYGWHLIA